MIAPALRFFSGVNILIAIISLAS